MKQAARQIAEGQMYLSPSQAAIMVGVAPRTIKKWYLRKANPLPAALIGGRRLIKRTQLESFIDSQVPEPAAIEDVKSMVNDIMADIKNRNKIS